MAGCGRGESRRASGCARWNRACSGGNVKNQSTDGMLVSVGAMSLQPLKIPTGLLIFKDLRFRGIWINKWYDNATPSERMEAFRPLFEMARRGLLKARVEKAYPLSEVKAAVAHAAQSKRSGKIILE